MSPIRAVPLLEGHANTNIRVELSDGSSVTLKLTQNQSGSPALERAIRSRLEGKVSMPERLHDGPGFSVASWIEGRSLQALLAEGRHGEVLESARDIGRALAAISSVTFDQAGFLDADMAVREPWSSSIDGLIGYLDLCLACPALLRRIGSHAARDIRTAFERFRRLLDRCAGPACLCHGDFKASNLIVNAGRLTGVVDWEYAHSGTWLLSAGQVLRDDERLPESFQAEFARGLEEAGQSLPADWEHAARILDVVNLVDFLGREGMDAATLSTIRSKVDRVLGRTMKPGRLRDRPG